MKKERTTNDKCLEDSYMYNKGINSLSAVGLIGLSIFFLFMFGLAYLDKEKEVAKAYKDAATITSKYSERMDSTLTNINDTNTRYNLIMDSIEFKTK